MKAKIMFPRDRPERIATIAAPPDCDAGLVELRGGAGTPCIAERDPLLPRYHAVLPAAAAGQVLEFDAVELSEAGAAAGLAWKDEGGRLEVEMGGMPFMTFHHSGTYPKPVINPILTAGGRNMLREPSDAYGEGEHPWQRGLTLMQGSINGVDCWNESSPTEHGRTQQDAMSVRGGPLWLCIESDNTWYQGEKPLATDHRFYRLFDTPRDAVVLDVGLTMTASHGPVVFGPTKEAGFLCIRVNPSMNAADRGSMVNSYGASDEAGCWSKRAHWMDYYGPVEDETAGFAVFDDPDNLRYPTRWHVRGYGLFAPNRWMKEPDHLLVEGETLALRWRVVIHAGDTEQADIRDRFLDYVDGPRVEWS